MDKDYFLLISSAKEHIENIKIIQENLQNKDYLYVNLNMEIRYCLSDLQSSLDYYAYELFMNFQYPKLLDDGLQSDKLGNLQRNVNFPHKYKAYDFQKDVKKYFKVVDEKNPEFIDFLEKIQPYNFENHSDSWLFVLNKLANESKHRNLTNTTKYQNGVIKDFQYAGITMKNVTFENVGEAVNIAGMTLDKETAQKLGAIFEGEIQTIAIFEENRKPVVDTLVDLVQNVENLLIRLNNTIKNS